MLAKSGRGVSGGGSGRVQAALARGGGGAPGRPLGGAPGRHVQQLVDAIIELGYLPTQSKHSTVAEKQLAVRLLKARKACSLSSKQEAALDKLAQRVAHHRVALRRAEARIAHAEKRAEARTAHAEKLMQEVRDLGRYPKESKRVVVERQLAKKLRRARRAKLSRGQLSVGSRRKQWTRPWGRSPPPGTRPSSVKLYFDKIFSGVRANRIKH